MVHAVIVGIDDESLDTPDVAVARLYMFAAPNLHLSRWHTIVNDELGTASPPHVPMRMPTIPLPMARPSP